MSWSRRRVSKLMNRMLRGAPTKESKDMHQNYLEQSDMSTPEVTDASIGDNSQCLSILKGNILNGIPTLGGLF